MNTSMVSFLIPACLTGIFALLAASCGKDENAELVGTGMLPEGQWILLIQDMNGRAVSDARLTLSEHPKRPGEMIPFDGHMRGGYMRADSEGRIILALTHPIAFGLNAELPALDNRIHIEANGYAPLEFWFYNDLVQGKVGVSCPAPEGAQAPKGIPAHCYRVILTPSPQP